MIFPCINCWSLGCVVTPSWNPQSPSTVRSLPSLQPKNKTPLTITWILQISTFTLNFGEHLWAKIHRSNPLKLPVKHSQTSRGTQSLGSPHGRISRTLWRGLNKNNTRNHLVGILLMATRNPANSPVEVGSLSRFTRFFYIPEFQVVGLGISSIISIFPVDIRFPTIWWPTFMEKIQ